MAPYASKLKIAAPAERRRLKQALLELPGVQWTEKPEQYCEFRLDGEGTGGWLRAKQFTNGTLYLEASAEDSLARMLALTGNGPEALITRAAPAAPSTAREKPSGLLAVTGPYIGTDESGKGDYFGPLVVAGALVDEKTAAILAELGVMDSKKLTPAKITALAGDIVRVLGPEKVNVVEIGPAKYNELYARFKGSGKNLNHLLAWGHATVIENLLARCPDCTQAIADQFGNERYILSQLKEKGRQITLHQTPRAEANAGVAAASIIARHRFVSRLERLSQQGGIHLPTGAGPQVLTQARAYLARHGRERLGDVAKLHFKTTESLGLPAHDPAGR